jgi:hypothetical protein
MASNAIAPVEDTRTNDMRGIAERLPGLSANDLKVAREQSEWAEGMTDFYPPGMTHDMPEQGLVLQVVSEDTVRFISVVDHIASLTNAALVKASFEEAGITVEMDPFTVLIPYGRLMEGYGEDERGDEFVAGPDPLGMEVA